MIVEDCSFADAIFESCSGLTTTGATVFSNLHEFPESLLLWRSLSQWAGGLGVVVFFVAILSSLGAGAKILFSNESSGASSDFKQGRVQQGAFFLWLYYLLLTVACLLSYRFGGMDWFQAVNHAMTTVATGGFSTEAASFEHFNSPLLEWIAIFFMLLSATTFVLVIRMFRGRLPKRSSFSEVFWFFGFLIVSVSLLVIYLVELDGSLPDHEMIRTATFQATSILTTTGYASADFDAWLPPAKMLLIVLMFIGGCSGSTAGGIKMVRLVIAVRAVSRSIIHAFRPNVTQPIRMGGRLLNESAIQSVVIFLLLIQPFRCFQCFLLQPVNRISVISEFSLRCSRRSLISGLDLMWSGRPRTSVFAWRDKIVSLPADDSWTFGIVCGAGALCSSLWKRYS